MYRIVKQNAFYEDIKNLLIFKRLHFVNDSRINLIQGAENCPGIRYSPARRSKKKQFFSVLFIQ